MKTELVWEHAFDDGLTAKVRYVRAGMFGRDRLFIDGREIRLPGMFATLISGGIDVPLSVGGRKLRFVSNDFLIGFAENGVFGKTGVEYVPQNKTVYVFYLLTVACLLIPLFTLGGATPSLIGFAGMGVCFLLYKTNVIKNKYKIIYSALTTALCWAVTLALFFGGAFTFRLFTGPETRTYTLGNFSITLNEDFTVEEEEGFLFYAYTDDVAIDVYDVDISYTASGIVHFPTAYEEAVSVDEHWGYSAEITEKDETCAVMEYTEKLGGGEYYIYTVIHRKDSVFLYFNFMCYAANKYSCKPSFEKWAESIVIIYGGFTSQPEGRGNVMISLRGMIYALAYLDGYERY